MDKLEKLETIVRRMGRRVHQTTATIVTPHLISAHKSIEVYGDILNMMLFKGKITKALICFDKRPKVPVHVEVKMLTGKEGFSKSYYLEKIRSSVELDLDTLDGTIITVSINPVSEEDERYKINQIWLSILWQPHISKANVDRYLIDSLDTAAKDLIEADSNVEQKARDLKDPSTQEKLKEI
jgi:hypothetical protein